MSALLSTRRIDDQKDLFFGLSPKNIACQTHLARFHGPKAAVLVAGPKPGGQMCSLFTISNIRALLETEEARTSLKTPDNR
jgi:hypothetical protein